MLIVACILLCCSERYHIIGMVLYCTPSLLLLLLLYSRCTIHSLLKKKAKIVQKIVNWVYQNTTHPTGPHDKKQRYISNSSAIESARLPRKYRRKEKPFNFPARQKLHKTLRQCCYRSEPRASSITVTVMLRHCTALRKIYIYLLFWPNKTLKKTVCRWPMRSLRTL